MKKCGKVLWSFLGILCILGELLEFLLLPAVFLFLGLWQQLPWQYYAITIGGYFGLFILLEGILHCVFRMVEKKYSSRFVKKSKKLLSVFSKDGKKS